MRPRGLGLVLLLVGAGSPVASFGVRPSPSSSPSSSHHTPSTSSSYTHTTPPFPLSPASTSILEREASCLASQHVFFHDRNNHRRALVTPLFSRAAPSPWEKDSSAEVNRNEALSSEEEQEIKPNPRLLTAGAKVAVSGAEGKLGRLVTKRLFQAQFRPHLIVPTEKQAPRGLGLEQHRGLTRYITDANTFPVDVKALVLVDEKGYTARQVERILDRALKGGVRRVVMMSSTGVERRNDWSMKMKTFGVNLEERHKAECALLKRWEQGKAFDYILVRVGRLRGGGGEAGLGDEMYDSNRNFIEAQMDETFDQTMRGFTMSTSDNIHGDSSRVLVAEVVVKALASDRVTDIALSVVSEPGRTYHNFQVAPWDLF